MKHYHHMTLDIFVSTCHCSVLSVTSVHQRHRLEYIYSYVDLTDWFTHHITNSLSLITVWTERSASRLPRPSSLMTSLPRIRYRHSVTACWYFLASHQQWDGPRESPDPHRWLRNTTGHRQTNREVSRCTYSTYLAQYAGSDMAMKQQLVRMVHMMNRLNNVSRLRKNTCRDSTDIQNSHYIKFKKNTQKRNVTYYHL